MIRSQRSPNEPSSSSISRTTAVKLDSFPSLRTFSRLNLLLMAFIWLAVTFLLSYSLSAGRERERGRWGLPVAPPLSWPLRISKHESTFAHLHSQTSRRWQVESQHQRRWMDVTTATLPNIWLCGGLRLITVGHRYSLHVRGALFVHFSRLSCPLTLLGIMHIWIVEA